MKMDPRELTVCMGNGEWYVGTRGGFGDHGAMLFGKQGNILHSVFLTIAEMQPEYIPLPSDYQVFIIRSYKTSSKSAERLFAYNQTIFAYSMALTLIKDALRDMCYGDDFLDQINYLGEITPESLGLRRIYEILRALPERITMAELKRRYSTADIDSRLDRFFGQLGKYPESVEVRGAALWGIAESERSRVFARLIKNGKIREAGELMYIGHDGDRLFRFKNGDLSCPLEFTDNKVTDEYLDTLIADIKSGDQDRMIRAELARQPGDFNASSLELDTIVEIARNTNGVAGASLTGAGFGGNVLALGKKDENVLESLKSKLFEGYYEPHERAELEWIKGDRELESAFGIDELERIRYKLEKIILKKQRAKSSMDKSDLEYAKSVQRKVNTLFKEGKIDRELMFITADYYTDGVMVNIPVDGAGIMNI
jgi:galactokinase